MEYISKSFYPFELAHESQTHFFRSETSPLTISWTLGLFFYLKLLCKASKLTHLCPDLFYITGGKPRSETKVSLHLR
jgi:hypothetical protein